MSIGEKAKRQVPFCRSPSCKLPICQQRWNSSAVLNRPIIGIDHGFGNAKTAHTCFRTGVTAHNKEPTFKSDLLIYEGRYYAIGEEHKEFIPDKALDQDYP